MTAEDISPWPSGYRLLTDPQLERIHAASLEILRRTGVRVDDAEARALLQQAGAVAEDDGRVKIPADVIEQALSHAPSRIVLSGRSGSSDLYLEEHRTYFGTGSDLPNTLDLDTGERRDSRLSDVEQVARLVEQLPNIDFVMSMALPKDVPPETSDRRSFAAMIRNTTKPVVFTCWDEVGLDDILAMARAVAGGAEALRLNPFLLAYLEPTSPLQHSAVVLRKLLRMADEGLPFVYSPGPIDGATAPCTPAGSLAMANAEVLSGLAIAQLRRPGAPFLYGSGSGPMDMRTTVASYSGPEFLQHCMGISELAHYYYRLPSWGFSGCTDSKLPDLQAGIDSALWILWTALSGANLVHDIGYIEAGLTCSYELIVICDEIISFVRRLLAGFELSPETLALDVIHEVGPGGDFLSHPHTRRNFRSTWTPRLFDRQAHHAWVASGRPTALEKARQLARDAVDKEVSEPLPDSTLEELEAIIAEADRRAGVSV